MPSLSLFAFSPVFNASDPHEDAFRKLKLHSLYDRRRFLDALFLSLLILV
jgi:hypothetical protein